MVGRALLLHCPVCGTGGLFGLRKRPLLGLPEQCRGCGLRFARESGHWTGSWGLNVIVSFTALFVVLIVGIAVSWPQGPGWPLAVVALGVALGLPLLFAPWSATLWLVIDLRLRPLTPTEEATIATYRAGVGRAEEADAGAGGDGSSGPGHHQDRQPEGQVAATQPSALEGGEAGEHPVE